MTETAEDGRSGEVVTTDASGWQHCHSLFGGGDRSDVLACSQRVDVAVMLIPHASFTTAHVVASELSESSAYFRGTSHLEPPGVRFSSHHSKRCSSWTRKLLLKRKDLSRKKITTCLPTSAVVSSKRLEDSTGSNLAPRQHASSFAKNTPCSFPQLGPQSCSLFLLTCRVFFFRSDFWKATQTWKLMAF